LAATHSAAPAPARIPDAPQRQPLPDPGAVAVAAGVAQRTADGTVVFGPPAQASAPDSLRI
jgi:hypothetical protein